LRLKESFGLVVKEAAALKRGENERKAGEKKRMEGRNHLSLLKANVAQKCCLAGKQAAKSLASDLPC